MLGCSRIGWLEVAHELGTLLAISRSEANRVGVALHQAGKYERAAIVFQLVAARYPDSASIWTNIAINYEKLGRDEEAKKARDRAIALDPLTNFAQQSEELFADEE